MSEGDRFVHLLSRAAFDALEFSIFNPEMLGVA